MTEQEICPQCGGAGGDDNIWICGLCSGTGMVEFDEDQQCDDCELPMNVCACCDFCGVHRCMCGVEE